MRFASGLAVWAPLPCLRNDLIQVINMNSNYDGLMWYFILISPWTSPPQKMAVWIGFGNLGQKQVSGKDGVTLCASWCCMQTWHELPIYFICRKMSWLTFWHNCGFYQTSGTGNAKEIHLSYVLVLLILIRKQGHFYLKIYTLCMFACNKTHRGHFLQACMLISVQSAGSVHLNHCGPTFIISLEFI